VPVLDIGFPRAYVQENLPTRLELQKQAPRKIRNVIWGMAVVAGCMALSVVKSHYPRVDLQRVEEGYAATTSDDAIDALQDEARPASEALVADLEVDGRPLKKE